MYRGRCPGPSSHLRRTGPFWWLGHVRLHTLRSGVRAMALTVWFGGAPFQSRRHEQIRTAVIDVPSGSEPKPALKGALGIQPGRCEAATGRLLTAMYRGIRPGSSSRLRHTGQLRLVRPGRKMTGRHILRLGSQIASRGLVMKGTRANGQTDGLCP